MPFKQTGCARNQPLTAATRCKAGCSQAHRAGGAKRGTAGAAAEGMHEVTQDLGELAELLHEAGDRMQVHQLLQHLNMQPALFQTQEKQGGDSTLQRA